MDKENLAIGTERKQWHRGAKHMDWKAMMSIRMEARVDILGEGCGTGGTLNGCPPPTGPPPTGPVRTGSG